MGRGNVRGSEKNERRTCCKWREKKSKLGLETHRYSYTFIYTHAHTHTQSSQVSSVGCQEQLNAQKPLDVSSRSGWRPREIGGIGSGYCEFYGAWHLNGRKAEEIADSVRKTLLMLHWLCVHPLPTHSPLSSLPSPPLAKFYGRPCCARICAACSSFGLYWANVRQHKAEHNGSLHVCEREGESECLSGLHV